MIPNKYTPIEKSKLYNAIKFYRSFNNMLISKESITSYKEIEYLTILYALEYIIDGGTEYFVRIR